MRLVRPYLQFDATVHFRCVALGTAVRQSIESGLGLKRILRIILASVAPSIRGKLARNYLCEKILSLLAIELNQLKTVCGSQMSFAFDYFKSELVTF